MYAHIGDLSFANGSLRLPCLFSFLHSLLFWQGNLLQILCFYVVKEFLKVVFSLKHGIVMSLSAKIIVVNRLHCTS